MKDYKISDEKINPMIKNADEKDISRKCSILFLQICVWSYISYKFETFFMFKVILMLFIAYLPLKGIIFLAKSIILKILNNIQKKEH